MPHTKGLSRKVSEMRDRILAYMVKIYMVSIPEDDMPVYLQAEVVNVFEAIVA